MLRNSVTGVIDRSRDLCVPKIHNRGEGLEIKLSGIQNGEIDSRGTLFQVNSDGGLENDERREQSGEAPVSVDDVRPGRKILYFDYF